MADPTGILTSTPARSEAAMRRLTWIALFFGVSVWAATIALGGRWALDMLRYSSAPAPSILDQAAGVVLAREADQRNDVTAHVGMQLFDGDELATSFGSTAVVQLFDGTRVELFPEGRVRIEESRIGRFNAGATKARLAIEWGAARLTIPSTSDRSHTISVVTPHAPASFLPGAYTLRVGPEETRISTWDGRADVVLGGQPVVVDEGEKVVIARDASRYQVGDLLENVVLNGDFTARFSGWDPWDEREQNQPDVPGRIEIGGSLELGSPSLRVWRESERNAHNETGLRQRIDRDVSGARAVILEARVKVDYSSLSGGGYVGSEYPMMIRLRARDRRGSERILTQGFYYANPENRPTQRAQAVARGEWTMVRLDMTDELSQASTIESIEIFGAGHTFDASITDVRLLVD